MKKRAILISIVVVLLFIIIVGFLVLNFTRQKEYVPNVSIQKVEKIEPSKTYKEYSDPSGFTLSYPDNISITNNEIADDSTYADIQLFAKGVNGSLSLKITDSKYKLLDDWLKLNKGISSKEAKLGNLKAMEVQTTDRLLLGALDNGVFFDIEVPAVEKEFWMKVYNQVLTSFSFTPAESTASQTNDVSFEGEEVVE